ncbi:MAG: hypothetical protein IJN56_08490 [Clostridia bacterium]|nr:hypothetical protein [Clostridia bacterium]
MSIANEIQRIQGAKANIKAAIENKGVTVGDGTIDTYAEKIGEISSDSSGGYDQGYEDGKNSVVRIDKFATTFGNLFYQTTYPQDTEFVLEYGEYFKGSLQTLCRYSKGIKSIKIIGKYGLALNVSGAFANCADLETVDLSECDTLLTNIQNTFNGSQKLKTIKGELNFQSGATVVTPFSNCIALEDVCFAQECIEKSITFSSSSKLSDLSIQSIIDGLVDLTGGTAQTLTLHAGVGAKLTDEQKATITTKNWELVY